MGDNEEFTGAAFCYVALIFCGMAAGALCGAILWFLGASAARVWQLGAAGATLAAAATAFALALVNNEG